MRMNGNHSLFRSILLSLLLIAVLPAGQGWAKSSDVLALESARKTFLQAEQALEGDDWVAYRSLRQALQDYPLLPYLDYQALHKRFHSLTSSDISAALDTFSDTPLQYSLRRDWLNSLAKQGRWKTYLQFATPGGTITQQCHRLNALLKTGRRSEALDAVEPIWLSGHSRPKACDPILDAWIASGRLTPQLVWQRIVLAMDADQLRLTRYLKRYLPTADQAWVDRWMTLHREPANPKGLLRKNHAYADEIAMDILNRMIRTDLQKALGIWQQIHDDPHFSDAQRLSLARTLVAFLALKNDKIAMLRVREMLPARLRSDPRFSEKLLQVALRQNDWSLVLETVQRLDPEQQNDEQWRYWHARALDQLGRRDEAKEIFIPLAKERSYYGFMAADHLGKSFSFLHQTLPVNDALLTQVAALPGLLRARELFALNRTLEARREWNLALQGRSTDELKAAAKMAQQWDWPSQVILTLAKIRYWNDLELRFPLYHRQQIDQQAKDHGLESAWIYAILRQESAFSADARSRAGALGLMQLMPSTAKEVAAKTSFRGFHVNDLLRPEVNIELGASYLHQIYRKLQGNPVLATAAYNAGPSRVLRWLPERPLATDVWIETVPFSETREYLKRVLAYTVIYNHRLGNTPERLPAKWQQPIGVPRVRDTASVKSTSDV